MSNSILYMVKHMIVKKIVVGTLRANCYFVINNDEAIIIDPGDDINKIIKEANRYIIKGLYYTHSHPDHIGTLNDLEIKYHLKANDLNSIWGMEVINTPGHSKDSKTFYFKESKIMFTGDFLFKGTYGRCDLNGSSYDEMKKSLLLIKKYPEDIIIFPGHGKESSLGEEKDNIRAYLNTFDQNNYENN